MFALTGESAFFGFWVLVDPEHDHISGLDTLLHVGVGGGDNLPTGGGLVEVPHPPAPGSSAPAPAMFLNLGASSGRLYSSALSSESLLPVDFNVPADSCNLSS